jgi:hypothetical protein
MIARWGTLFLFSIVKRLFFWPLLLNRKNNVLEEA